MPTFMFYNIETKQVKRATAHAMNAARDMIPEAYDGTLWLHWECWQGGECLWHRTEDGETHQGARPK